MKLTNKYDKFSRLGTKNWLHNSVSGISLHKVTNLRSLRKMRLRKLGQSLAKCPIPDPFLITDEK